MTETVAGQDLDTNGMIFKTIEARDYLILTWCSSRVHTITTNLHQEDTCTSVTRGTPKGDLLIIKVSFTLPYEMLSFYKAEGI